MMNITKYFTKKIFSEFYILNKKLFYVIAAFSFYTAYNLNALDTMRCSVFEYALLGMSDQYYFTFFFLIIYILIISSFIKDTNAMFISRSTRYYLYFISKMFALLIFTVSIVTFHAMIAICIGLFKHDWQNTFTSDVNLFGNFKELIILYQSQFSSPLVALITVCLYLSIGLCIITGILILISHYFSEKLVILSEICGYFLIILALQRNIDSTAPLVFIINYLFLHRAIYYGTPSLFYVSSIIILMILLVSANRQRKQVLKFIIRLISPIRIFGEMLSYKNIVVVVLILFVLTILNVLRINVSLKSSFEYTMMLFWGYGLGYFHVIDFLQMVIINGLPIYILAIYLENKASMRNIVMIRYKKIADWHLKLQASMFMLILFQLMIMCVFAFFVGLAHNLFKTGSNHINLELFNIGMPLHVTAVGLILRTFEIMFIQILFLVIRSFVKNTTTAFLFVMSLYLLVTTFKAKFIPFGLSSLCRMSEISDNGLVFNFILTAAILVGGYLIMYLYLVTNKKVQKINYERK